MTIKIYSDRIDIGDYTLFEGNGGLQFDGVARAENFKGGVGTFQGSISGYTSGGYVSPPGGFQNVIDKFPFATNTNATDVGDLTIARLFPVGQSSTTHGYNVAGEGPPAPGVHVNTIDKFPFATDSNASDVGDLIGFTSSAGSGSSSTTHGYVANGYGPTPPNPPTGVSNTILKFPFASDTNASDVGDTTSNKRHVAGQSSLTHGYSSGGQSPTPGAFFNTIDKFPFATDTNATDIGDLSALRRLAAGQSSTTDGYTGGGATPPSTYVNTIDKFPFSSDTNASDIGDLTGSRMSVAGQSSANFGYVSGGESGPLSNIIDKFPFATNGNATDVGDLTVSRYTCTGQQV